MRITLHTIGVFHSDRAGQDQVHRALRLCSEFIHARRDMASYVLVIVVFFFFQAEDGIRDLTVTGVQTCALPISTAGICGDRRVLYGRRLPQDSGEVGAADCGGDAAQIERRGGLDGSGIWIWRSGERRVGEEGRSRWAPDHLKKKKKKQGIGRGMW